MSTETKLHQPTSHKLHFTVNHIPDWGSLLLYGFQVGFVNGRWV